MSDSIAEKVKLGKISTVCFDCAQEHRDRPMYDGTYNVRTGTCQICGEDKQVTFATKAFGFHKFI